MEANFTGIQCNGTDIRTYVCVQVVHSTVVSSQSQSDNSKHRHLSLVASFETLSAVLRGGAHTGPHSYTMCANNHRISQKKVIIIVLTYVVLVWSGPLRVTALHYTVYTIRTYIRTPLTICHDPTWHHTPKTYSQYYMLSQH